MEIIMENMNRIIKSMDFEYFAAGKHKQDVGIFLKNKDAILLDIRSQEEFETISLNLKHHMPVLQIPLNEIPDRLSEIPRDKTIGIFCSSGIRIGIAYTYLKTQGLDSVFMLPGGLDAIVKELKPGKILKTIRG